MIISDLEDRKLTKQVSLSQLRPLLDTTYRFTNKKSLTKNNTVDLSMLDSEGFEQIVELTGTNDINIVSISNTQLTIDAPGDKTFIFTQTNPVPLVWNIQHNLNKYPSVSVVDSANEILFGNVEYVNQNLLTITFTAGFSGFAYLN